MRPIESLLINKRMGRGSSWSSLDLETLESAVSSGKSAGAIAKDRGWPSSSVRQRVAAIKRGPSPRCVGGSPRRLPPELLDEIREFIEEEHGRISVKTRVKSLHIVSYLQSKGHLFVALASVGDPHSAPCAGPSHP